MHESKGVSQLVQHFFDGALPQQAFLRGKPVELLTQPAERDHGDGTVKLRLPKQETEHRDSQVDVRNPKNPGSIARSMLRQHLHDFYRLVLPSLGVIGAFWNR